MKMKNSIAVLLMMITGLQTAWAQKIILHMSDSQKVEYDISQVDSITIKDEEHSIIEEHEYVDLGLPSGTLWATCNVGANSPEEYGDYFAWGETEGYNNGKTPFNWSTYKYYDTMSSTITKYCIHSEYGSFDNKITLEPDDDAATANWGVNWQMPSIDQLRELINNDYTTTTWTTLNDVYGRLIVSKSNGNKIFLPAAGFRPGASLNEVGKCGIYWSRSLSFDNSQDGNYLYFNSGNINTETFYRCYGRSVRPVQVKKANNLFCNLPANFILENVYQAPALFTACNSMGEFCSITTNGNQFIFKGSSNEPYYVNLTALNGYSGFYLGLSGLIVGLPNIPELGETVSKVVCFDLACPNCYEDYNITKPLTLHNDGTATCASCNRTYNLNNTGVISNGEAGKPLYRYRVNYKGNTLIVKN